MAFTEDALVLFNAIQNFALVLDARPAADIALGTPLVAQALHAGGDSAGEDEWERPDEPVVVVLLSTAGDAGAGVGAAAAAAVARRFPHLPPPRFMALDFPAFAGRFPFAVAGGAPLPVPAPQLVHERGVFLGSALHARTQPLLAALARAGVSGVVNFMGGGGCGSDNAAALGLACGEAVFAWEDSVVFPILEELPAAVEAIEAGAAAGGVLVHCWAGASRSAAAVAAWLLWRHPERAPTVDAAHEWLRRCRPAVAINAGFVEQLRAFHGAAAEAAAAAGVAVAGAAELRAAVARAAEQRLHGPRRLRSNN
jgi:hypothetical protein